MAYLLHNASQSDGIEFAYMPDTVVNNERGWNYYTYYAWMSMNYAIVNDDIVINKAYELDLDMTDNDSKDKLVDIIMGEIEEYIATHDIEPPIRCPICLRPIEPDEEWTQLEDRDHNPLAHMDCFLHHRSNIPKKE